MRILVAVLNWGLGHASRSIPVIRELQRQDAEVLLASDGRALALLRQEFPELPFVELPGYGIRYSSANMALNMALQLPNIVRAIYLEHRLVSELVSENRIAGIVSDNRFGCYSKQIPCIFLTHQLAVKVSFHLPGASRLRRFWVKFSENAIRQVNHYFIKKYNECWVPDRGGPHNLSGELSHGTGLRHVRYIGALSRMQHWQVTKKYDLVAVLSGPEPQRTHLEEKLLTQLAHLSCLTLIVQGKTEQQAHFFAGENIEVFSSLPTSALNEALLAGKIFIGRSGYSTIMDLAKLRLPAILVPTPGQAEQEYLAHHFLQTGIFYAENQAALDVARALAAAGYFSGLKNEYADENGLREAVGNFLNLLPASPLPLP